MQELDNINFTDKISFPMLIFILRPRGKILNVIDKIQPFKDLRIKNNNHDKFDDEVAEAIKLREKRLEQFKSTKLLTDEDLYK